MNATPELPSGARPPAQAPLALALALMVALTGCSILRPAPDHSRYYVLPSSESTAATASTTRRDDIYLGLGPVRFPGYLDTQALVRSRDDTTIEYIRDAYWAEPVEGGFARALLFRTSSSIGTPHAVGFPWYATTRVDWKVPVDVLRFEATTAGVAVLVARWTVVRTSDGRVIASGESTLEETSGDDPARIVAALHTCLDRLADEIAGAVSDAATADPSDSASQDDSALPPR